jgi:poly(3-hydroxyalkanoate) synthetase
MKRAPVAVLFTLAAAGCFHRLYAPDRGPPGAAIAMEERYALAPDGWKLSLVRYRPERLVPGRRPVLLVHGIITNSRFFDVDPDHSFQRWMARRGFDTWALSLRTTGGSDHFGDHQKDPGAAWPSLEDFAEKDLPAALAAVRAATGSPAVDYLGHSLGGLIAYAYLGGGGEGVGSLVVCGSPIRFRWHTRVEELLRSGEPLLGLESLPLRGLSRATLPLMARLPTPLEPTLLNEDNVAPAVWRAYVSVGVDDLSGNLVRQAGRWIKENRFLSSDGKVDYGGRLGAVKAPALVVAGKVDNVAPPWLVRPGFEALGSPDKTWLIAGEAGGLSTDYGHLDMFVSDRAPLDLWPRLEAFLLAHEPQS